jgi:hypothetical protein
MILVPEDEYEKGDQTKLLGLVMQVAPYVGEVGMSKEAALLGCRAALSVSMGMPNVLKIAELLRVAKVNVSDVRNKLLIPRLSARDVEVTRSYVNSKPSKPLKAPPSIVTKVKAAEPPRRTIKRKAPWHLLSDNDSD